MAENEDDLQVLTAGAQKLVAAAAEKQREAGHEQQGLHHWLLALLERHGPMAADLVQGLDPAAVTRQMRDRLSQGDGGSPLDAENVMRQALERARSRGKERAAERDLAAVILTAAGYTPAEPVWKSPRPAAPAAPKPAAAATSPTFQPRVKTPTPALDFFGRDLTRAALEGKLSPLVGRESELQLVIETLFRRTKRNPVLVGPAGVGKTAIVEGLARLIVEGKVPEMLRGVRLIALQPSALVAGAGAQGELEHRMQNILTEAGQEGIVLFIDEIHSLIGAGGIPGTTDLSSQLKPALARGDLACIAATTEEEYRRFIEADSALERRFQPVRIEEPTVEQTLKVLSRLREEFAALRKVQIPDSVLAYLVNFADQYLRNRQFPDKAVDLLEQCVAHAAAQNKGAVDQADAEAVAQRTVGMPLALGNRLGDLAARLVERGLLTSADIEALVNRLQVTLPGLDLRPVRPNAVVLLSGPAAANAEPLAETIAEVLFGSARRVVTIDFGRFAHPADISLLVGAPPGYIGYTDTLPMHRVAHLGWCVLLGTNLHACNPQVREVFTQALASGYLTESRGRRIYLSDAIVLLTADIDTEAARPFGFGAVQEVAPAAVRQAAEQVLGDILVAQCNLIATTAGKLAVADQRRWFQDHLAGDLSARYRRQGIDLRWHESVVDWLLAQAGADAGPGDWERLVDDHLAPLLVRSLAGESSPEPRSILIKVEGNQVQIEIAGEKGRNA
jgi:ATP-dependent Clp protease ATP-binding subunit ClpC